MSKNNTNFFKKKIIPIKFVIFFQPLLIIKKYKYSKLSQIETGEKKKNKKKKKINIEN